ncbi:MAG TPA: DUF2249 domain-containing protein [Streptosporangiaceae bacterium]|nr:DUF2249 domain-containing protein [Streptosporangiaceae bacterium]
MTTITATEAYEAMLEHHKRLAEQLAGRADAVSGAAAAGRPHGAAVAGLIAYLAEEILPHAAAEETTIYPAAAQAGLADVVGEMTAEHRTLTAAGERLAALTDGAAAADQAQQIAALFAAHAAKENDLLLPALLADHSVDLAALLGQMHDSAGHDEAPAPDAAHQAEDPQAAVVSLLLQAAAALARAGEADRACRIAASAWATLHETRPDLAAKVTAALHGLTRRTGEAPATTAHGGEPEAIAAPVLAGPDLDVRDLPPARRHATIFDAYTALLPGTGFVLVNDHDPKPLRYQFEAEHAGQFTWDALESGPDVWRVRIGRPAAAAPGKTALREAGPDGDADEPDLDVRPVSHAQRHGLIFAAYRALRPGAGFVLVNDHDPKPLRYQFEAQYAGEYTWDYQQDGPSVWRVRIGRAVA